ncbi:DUF3800 domain-containing protein [Yersinia enterocolitica]|nr:hypothetical protein [Yersinia enterocolitica]ELI7917449.1 DUF3800 domain-containing protein [Yersinia enterocolitica]ELI8322812.1 DUF3800 domain-containing protein [Yersinia enterocolitica]
MGVYVYADESGNSGKKIFDPESPTYFQGSIISLGDVDKILDQVITQHCQKLNVLRLHANQLQETVVANICNDLLDALETTSWQFFTCMIHKPYLVPTKFVDLFFDCYDNPGVPMLWYTTDLFRHTLCLGVNYLLTDEDAKAFWEGYLKDDIAVLINTASILLSRVNLIGDRRVKEVMAEGLKYAISHSEEFTLICTQGKSAYKKQTPNIVAFSSLMAGTHQFCKKHKTSVKQLVHDRSDEFRGTMREYHRIFHKLDYVENTLGGPFIFEEAEHDLGTFDIKSSENHPALQAVDIFLWMLQRNLVTDVGKAAFTRLKKNMVDFIISPTMSEFIIHARAHQFNSTPLSTAQLEASKKLFAELEVRRQERLQGK